MKSTCEREILKLFWVTKCKGFNSLKLQKNNEEKSYKLITLILWKKNYAFSSDCRLQIRINYLKSQCNQWGRLIGINGQLAVCISKVIIFKQYIVTGLPVRPSYKFSFLSSVYKNGLPGEGRHEGLVLRNDVLTNGFIYLLHEPLHGYFLYLVCAPPEKPTKRCEPEEGYLRCSKRFDHGSHSIIFLLFEFKSVRWCWRWETQRNARVAFKPTRRSR